MVDESDVAVPDQAVDDEVGGAIVPRQRQPRDPQVGNGLTERERQVLAFERQWWRRSGAKEQAIRDLFGFSSTRYYQLLNRVLDNPLALAHDPVLVKRLRRLRASRTRTPSGEELR